MALKLSPQELRHRIRSLPTEVREIYSSEEAADAIRAAGEKNGLRVDQLSELESLVSQVLLGILSIGKFSQTLQQNLSLDDATNTDLVREIEEHIFKPIRTVLVESSQKAKSAPVIPDEPLHSSGERSWSPPGVPKESAEQQDVNVPAQPKQESASHPYTSGDPYKEAIDEV